MGFNPKVNGTYRDTNKIAAKVAGVWKDASNVWVKAGGVWKSVWSSGLKMMRGQWSGAPSFVSHDSSLGYAQIYCASGLNANGAISTLVTSVPIDLTNVTNVQLDWLMETNSSIQSDAMFIASKIQMGDQFQYDIRVLRSAAFSRRVESFSVAALSGSYYLRVQATKNPDNGWYKNVLVYRILLDGVVIWDASIPGGFITP